MSANLVWSIALAAIGITGLWLAGSGRRGGWALGLSAQLLWIVFALVTAQYGFIASALAYGFVYARNWRRAWRADAAPVAEAIARLRRASLQTRREISRTKRLMDRM